MSKTLKLNVSFPLSIVIHSETIKELQESREEARALTTEEVSKFRGQRKANYLMLISDKPDEEIFEVIYRAGIREHMRTTLLKDLQGNEARIRLGDVKVVFEKFEKPTACALHDDSKACTPLCSRMLVTQ